MSAPGDEYCLRERLLPHRQIHELAGNSLSSDHYHLNTSNYDTNINRFTPVGYDGSDRHVSQPPPLNFENNDRYMHLCHNISNSERQIPSNLAYDYHCERHCDPDGIRHPPQSYDISGRRFSSTTVYDANDKLLPTTSSSPNHFALRTVSDNHYIPPPDKYLSPPAPAPPDRFIQNRDHFSPPSASTSTDLYLPPTSSVADRFQPPKTPERVYDRYVVPDRYIGPSPSNSHSIDHYADRYDTSYPGGPGDPYVRRDLGYHHHYRLPNPNYYHKSLQRSSVRPHVYNPHHSNIRVQKCCSSGYQTLSRDLSPINQSRIRSNCAVRGNSSSSGCLTPVSLQAAFPPASISLEYASVNGGRYLSTSSASAATLPRCNSYNDVHCTPVIQVTRKTCPLNVHQHCCASKRTNISPNSTFSTNLYADVATISSCATVSSPSYITSSPASSNIQQQQQQIFQQSSSWRPIISTFQTSNVDSPLGSSTPVSNPQSPSGVNSPSVSGNSSRSSPLTVSLNASSGTASASVAGPSNYNTAISSTSNGVHDTHQRSASVPVPDFEEEEILSSKADDSLSSTNVSMSPQPYSPPSSLPIQPTFKAQLKKYPLKSQRSVPVTSKEFRRYNRSASKSELFKNFIRRETAVFFGVHEPTEESEKARWLDRTKRLAARKYGKLKAEYEPSSSPFSTSAGVSQPDVLPISASSHRGPADERDATEFRSIDTSTLRRKPSVAKMTFDGVAYVVSTLSRHPRKRSSSSRQWSRSYVPSSVPPTPASPMEDEVFFDKETADSTSSGGDTRTTSSNAPLTMEPRIQASAVDHIDSANEFYQRPQQQRMPRDRYHTWRRANESRQQSEDTPEIGLSRIWSGVINRVLDNSDRREYGMGVVGRFFGRSLKRSVMNREPVKEQLEDLEDHRPFFTYWVTTVQILILALSIFAYGLGPIGVNLTQRSGLVLVTSLSLQQVEFSEPSNFWIGPRAADLIHMGAKFAPCMRKDKKIIKEIEKIRDRERDTACCIRNDDSGCVQASKSECSNTISTWKKWSDSESGPGGRLSGSVCGLDPKFCEAPASIAPYEWPDDITKWPICRKMNSRFPVHASHDHHRYQKDKMAAEHMICEVIGHPCCIGIHGTCRITTKEYCDFVHGYFHEDASLCSQVSCLDDVCGMIPFYFPETPDQFYRLWTSLFIHAGVLHLSITISIQYLLMRDLEKLTGSLRIGIIYIGSGVAGNLASAIFVPYRADVGPAGSQFGLLACLIVEVLNCWPMLKHPVQALMKLLAITCILFIFGLLPWVDNFAHLFGFIFGFLLSYALLPFVSFGPYDRQKKIFLIWVCLLSSLFLFILLMLLFYLIPIYDCEICHYFNCIPLTRDFCATQNINFKREEYKI